MLVSSSGFGWLFMSFCINSHPTSPNTPKPPAPVPVPVPVPVHGKEKEEHLQWFLGEGTSDCFNTANSIVRVTASYLNISKFPMGNIVMLDTRNPWVGLSFLCSISFVDRLFRIALCSSRSRVYIHNVLGHTFK